MKDIIEKLKCELCNKSCGILVQIKVAGEGEFISPRGLCTECFKAGDIEHKVFLRNKKFCVDQIKLAKDRVKYWDEVLKKIK